MADDKYDPYAPRQTAPGKPKAKGKASRRPKERATDQALAEDKPAPHAPNPGNTSRDQLRSFVERIERLEDEKKVIADDHQGCLWRGQGHGV